MLFLNINKKVTFMNDIALSNEKKQLINKFSNWVMNLQFDFLQDKLFQPIGIELSVIPIVLDTIETTKFSNLTEDELGLMPLAYYDFVDDKIHIFIEHNSFKIRSESEKEQQSLLMMLLFHEACHRLLMSIQRQNEREMMLWNIATDYEIHNMLYLYSKTLKASRSFSELSSFMEHIDSFLFDKSDEKKCEGLFEQDFLNLIAEEIYQYLLNSKEEETKTFEFYNDGTSSCTSSGGASSQCENGNSENESSSSNDEEKDENGCSKDDDNNKNKKITSKIRVKVTKYKLPNGKEITVSNVEYDVHEINKNKSKEDIEKEQNGELLRKTILENTLKDASERLKGNIPAECSEFLKKMFHVKIDWKKILRNSIQSILDKSDYFTWSRPRLSMFGLSNAPYLPSQAEDFEKYGVLIIARDESGSMTNDEVAKAAGIIADAKEYYKKIILIKHDTDIISKNEFEEISDEAKNLLLKRECCGGTSHEKVFKWIKEYSIAHQNTDDAISCVILITDLESDIEKYQDTIPSNIPMVYLSPSNMIQYHKKIKGLIIPVEI